MIEFAICHGTFQMESDLERTVDDRTQIIFGVYKILFAILLSRVNLFEEEKNLNKFQFHCTKFQYFFPLKFYLSCNFIKEKNKT